MFNRNSSNTILHALITRVSARISTLSW